MQTPAIALSWSDEDLPTPSDGIGYSADRPQQVTIGSGAIFDIYSANDYAQNQAVLVGTSADLTPSLKAPIETLKSELVGLRDMVDQAVESVVSLLVIFILQTLVLPLLLLWAYYRTLASIGHWRWLDRSTSR